MRLDGEEWQAYFRDFKHSAFRLETLPQYLVPQEAELFQRFRAGTSRPSDEPNYWTELVSAARSAEKTMQRVHVVTRPLSDYLRFEFTLYYEFNVKAGEDVRILDLTDRPNPGLPDFDYWLFDSSIVVRMDYEADGTQIGRELLTDPDLVKFCQWRDIALSESTPFAEYAYRG